MKQMVHNLLYGNVNKSFYKDNRDLLDAINFRAVKLLYYCSVVFCSILVLISLSNQLFASNTALYVALTLVSLTGAILVKLVLPNHLRYVAFAYYSIEFFIFFLTLYSGIVPHPNYPGVCIFFYIIVVSVIYINTPYKAIALSFVEYLIFILSSIYFKGNYPTVIQFDLIDTLYACLMNLILILYIRNLHLSQINEKLLYQEKSNLDALTGLQNRSYVQEQCEQFIQSSKLNHSPATCGLLIINIDNFHSVNNQFGHHRGDALLKLMGGILKSSFLGGDIIGRMKDDEFLVMMKNLSDADVISAKASSVQKQFQEACSRSGFPEMTCSVGICAPDPGIQSFKQIYNYAHHSLEEIQIHAKGSIGIYHP